MTAILLRKVNSHAETFGPAVRLHDGTEEAIAEGEKLANAKHQPIYIFELVAVVEPVQRIETRRVRRQPIRTALKSKTGHSSTV